MAFKAAGGAIAKIPVSIMKTVTNVLGKGARGIFNLMIKPIEWLGSIFGAGASKMIQAFKSRFNGIFDDITRMFTKPSTAASATVKKPGLIKQVQAGIKSDITKPWQAATKAQKMAAARKGAVTGGVVYGLTKGIQGLTGSNNSEPEKLDLSGAKFDFENSL